MPDLRPPRIDDDERSTVMALWQYHRESFVRKVHGIDAAGARFSPVASGTSLLWLAQHLANAEQLWVVHRFAGETYDGTPAATLPDAVAVYRRVWSRVDAIVAAHDLTDMCRAIDAEPNVSLRWVVAHLLEETARHAGHADIIREVLDGATGR